MTKQKTIPELQAEIAANERQLAQLQHKQQQLENRRSYYEKVTQQKTSAQAYHPWGDYVASILSGDLFPRRLEKWSLPRRY
ncbi:MAG: hypothetical protein ACLR8U_05790 [Oscillospiraceae bacterium]